eukprot:116914_1
MNGKLRNTMLTMKVVMLCTISNIALADGPSYRGLCYAHNDYDLSYYAESGILLNTSNVNVDFQYIYSPCNLSFYSDDTHMHYAMKRYNIQQGITKYLIPDLNVRATKDPNQNILTWKFTYEYSTIFRGCPNSIQIVDIYWQCDTSINNDPYYYQVVSAGSLFECFDSIFIKSPFACNDSNVYPKYQFDCSFTSNGNTIHLNNYTDSNEEIITDKRGENKTFIKYSPCRNKIRFNNWAMIGSTTSTGKYTTYQSVLATWNMLSENESYYYYDPLQNIWNFTYFGYNMSSPIYGDCIWFITYILFGCNCVQQQNATEVYGNDDKCSTIMNITRLDLCIDYINQCYPDKNNTDCVYYWRPSTSVPYDVLNLSLLTDTQIGGVEDGGLYAFIYTPCNNNFLCAFNDSNQAMSMAGRVDINQQECFETLAIFNGTDSFTVDKPKNWLIEYSSGAQCPSKPLENIRFSVEWEYTSSNIPWKVEFAQFISDECVYYAKLISKYA